jgi:hypothetical protein
MIRYTDEDVLPRLQIGIEQARQAPRPRRWAMRLPTIAAAPGVPELR